jgi:hypothetical protein
MSPMNLLTTGRTILGLKERPGRYKLMGNSVLPKFSRPNRSSPTTPHPVVQNPQPALFEQAKPVVVARKEAETAAPGKDSTVTAATSIKKKEQPVSPFSLVHGRKPSKPGMWEGLADWVQKWIPTHKAPPSPLESFQTELALEKIKVMRNDLSEDDLEVVMIDSKVGNKAGKPVQVERVDLERIAASP